MNPIPKLLQQSNNLFSQLKLGIIRYTDNDRGRVRGTVSIMQRLMIILFEISAMWPMGVQTGVSDLADITGASEVHELG